MYLFLLAVFNPNWRDENEDMSFHPSLLVAEGMSASLNDDEILNLSFGGLSVPKQKEPIKISCFYL